MVVFKDLKADLVVTCLLCPMLSVLHERATKAFSSMSSFDIEQKNIGLLITISLVNCLTQPEAPHWFVIGLNARQPTCLQCCLGPNEPPQLRLLVEVAINGSREMTTCFGSAEVSVRSLHKLDESGSV